MAAKWWKARGAVRVRSDSNTEMRKILRASRVGWYRSIARTIGRPSGRGRIRHDQYEGKAEVARARGATAAFLYEGGLFADKVRDVTNGRGVDVIFDPVGKPTFRDSLRATRLGTLAKRMREQGQICCLCRLPLAPPHPMAERLCAKCSAPHRVYLHASNYSNFWFVQFLEEDLRTSFCGNLTYSTLDEIRELLRRLKVTVDQGEAFEEGIRRWSIGTCFVTLTTRQHVTLKTQFPRKGT